MNAAFVFSMAMFAVSALVWALAFALSCLERRFRNWPAFWAVAFFACVATPLLAALFLSFPMLNPASGLHMPYLHDPLEPLGSIIAEQIAGAETQKGFSIPFLESAIGCLYLLGVGVCLLRLTAGRGRAHAIARRATATTLGGDRKFYLTDEVTTPYTYSPFGRPEQSKIVIPAQLARRFSAPQLRDILDHEAAHIVRRDDETGLALRTLLAVCWISPFAYALFKRWGDSIETQCDIAVAGGRSTELRRAYAETLLDALRLSATQDRRLPAASFSANHLRSEKMRLRNIMAGAAPSFQGRANKTALNLAAAAIIASGAFTLSAQADDGDANGALVNNISFMLEGRLTASYGVQYDPFKSGKTMTHYGIDIAAPIGTPIYAPANGAIIEATDLYNGKAGYGKVIVIETADGTRTLLSHLGEYSVQSGQKVKKGEQIATVGLTGKTTGPHVHVETYQAGERVDPMETWPFKK